MNAYEQYCTNRFKLLKRNLKKYIDKNDEEGLHQFRVELKKIAALLHLIQSVSRNDLKDSDKELNILLKSAGELRDAHNFIKLANEFKLPKSISGKTIRRGQIKKATGKLKSWRKHPHSLNVFGKQLNNCVKKLTAAQLKMYLTGLINEISDATSKAIPEDNLHELRKEMKDVLYLLKLSGDKNSDKKKKQILERLDECQDVIGQWHDVSKFRERLKKLKHPRLKNKMAAIMEEEKRLLTEIYRLLRLLEN